MRTFYLNGLPYEAPEQIGYGVQLKVASRQRDLYLAANSSFSFEEWLSNNEASFDVQLVLIECLLRPLAGSPSVEEGFMSATREEVFEIIDFFASSIIAKDSGPQATLLNGKAGSRRRTAK